MNLGEVITLTNNIIDEVDYDEQIESIIKNAINYAYLTIATKIDKRSEIIDITCSKIVKLPSNCNSVIDIFADDYILSSSDYSIKSDNIIFHNSDFSTLKLLYNKNISPLVNNDDILEIDDRYCFACAMYGAYVYSIHRKRIELAGLLLSDYNRLLSDNKTTELEVNEFDTKRYSQFNN